MTTNFNLKSFKSSSSNSNKLFIRQGCQSCTILRGSFRCWIDETKMNSNVSKLKRHFKNTFKEEQKETGNTPEEFQFIRELGTGSYGKMKLVHSLKTLQLGALKVIDRSGVNVRKLRREIRIMKSLLHPFLVEVRSHFTIENQTYLEIPFYASGDLTSFLKAHGKCCGDLARFYGAQLFMAIDFLHSVGVMNIDMNPQNIMIDDDGYLKIVGFGLSKNAANDRLLTFCGTPEYMAPEMCLARDKYQAFLDKSADWWSFGLIMFNILTGTRPFAKDFVEIEIMCVRVQYPTDLEYSSKEFINALLQVEAFNRLGCGKGGAREIRMHPWFHGVNWPGLYFKQVKAPCLPTIYAGSILSESAVYNDEDGTLFGIENHYVTDF